MLIIEKRGFDKLAKDLHTFAAKAMPYAMRDSVNAAAFEARRLWSDEIKRTFTTRNSFTAGRALEVEKARGTKGPMVARLGSTADYMGRQETGGIVRGSSGHRPIPGPSAAGQAPGTKRTRIVRAGMRLRAIKASDAKGKTGKQRNAIALAMARRTGQKFAVLQRPGGGLGLFSVGGGKRKIRTRLIWDLSRRSARVPAHATLGPAIHAVQPRLQTMHEAALLKQLRFHKVLGY